jgi:hypothetical protein
MYDDEYDGELIEDVCKLFEKYAALLNQEFRDNAITEKVGLECVAIAK